MIHIFVTRFGSHTFRDYLKDWAGDVKDSLRVHFYEHPFRWPKHTTGVFIFSDLERLNPYQLEVVRQFRDRLIIHHPDCRIINDPRKALLRLELLNAMHDAGINQFNAYPVNRLPDEYRFPVFLRGARDHSGPRTSLLQEQKSVDVALHRMVMRGMRPDETILVEYCNTQDTDGIFRKYSSFRFGDRIIPAHIVYSHKWVAKDGPPPTDALREEQRKHIATDPHRHLIRDIFNRAHITYGRIDYSLLDENVQVWEINTNPVLLKDRSTYENDSPEVLPDKEKLAMIIRDSLQQLDNPEQISDAN